MIYKQLNKRIFRVLSVIFVYFSANTEKTKTLNKNCIVILFRE